MNPSTRKEARAAGLKRFYTGKPCLQGHVAERYLSGGCVVCHKAKRKTPSGRRRSEAGAARDRDSIRAHVAREARIAPPPLEKDCPPRPDDGLCQACGRPVGKFKLHMDHDHDTGAFRAWVCQSCNQSRERRSDIGQASIDLANEVKRLKIG